MKEQENTIETLFQKMEEQAVTTFDLYKLKSVQQVAKIIPNLLFGLLICIILLFMLATLTVSASIFIGKVLGQNYYGYLLVSAFYILALFFLFTLKSSIKQGMKNRIIKYLLS
jgi:hypothetical protein